MHPSPAHVSSAPAFLRVAHWVGLVVFAGLMGMLGRDLWRALADTGLRWTIAILAVAGYLIADLVSGLVHFLADNFAEADTPVIGPAFVRPFREHHRDPLLITQHGFVEANGNNVLVSLPVVVLVLWLLPIGAGTVPTLVGGFVFFFIFAIFLTNQFHKWAHMPSPPRWVERLQAAGLILSKQHHDVHHTSPFNTYYCITVGVWNPLFHQTRFFDRLERFIRRWLPGTDPRTRVAQEAEAAQRKLAASGARGVAA
jgi:hypothetical protein